MRLHTGAVKGSELTIVQTGFLTSRRVAAAHAHCFSNSRFNSLVKSSSTSMSSQSSAQRFVSRVRSCEMGCEGQESAGKSSNSSSSSREDLVCCCVDI